MNNIKKTAIIMTIALAGYAVCQHRIPTAYKDTVEKVIVGDTCRCTIDTNTLLCAAINGDAEKCATLIENGASLETKDRWEWTPLMCAVWHGKDNVVRLLVESGANINARDSIGTTALTLADLLDRKDLVKYLKKNGAK